LTAKLHLENIVCRFDPIWKKCLHGISNQYTICDDVDDVHFLINIWRWSFGDANFIENYVFVSGKTYFEDNEIEIKSLPTRKEN